MKKIKSVLVIATLISAIFSFNIFAMPKNENANEPVAPTPSTEVRNEDRTMDYDWTWINDSTCVQFRVGLNKSTIERKYEIGISTQWHDNGNPKRRDTYSGKWTVVVGGAPSFRFDDCTIPVGVAKIDNVLYAFNSFGELKEGYNYWGDLKTAADGLVVTDNPEFTAWMATQYIPACTSHE